MKWTKHLGTVLIISVLCLFSYNLHLQAVQLDAVTKTNERLSKQLIKLEDRQNIDYTLLNGDRAELEKNITGLFGTREETLGLKEDTSLLEGRVALLETKVSRLDNYSGNDYKDIANLKRLTAENVALKARLTKSQTDLEKQINAIHAELSVGKDCIQNQLNDLNILVGVVMGRHNR